jgi:Icc-related predicted phosphoesterase
VPDVLRVAAVGDVHCDPVRREEAIATFAGVGDDADLLLIAGDLTTTGEPEQAAVLVDAVREAGIPVFAVLGNHDHHAGRAEEIVRELDAGGIHVLERDHATCRIGDLEVGIVGTKGFVGGFQGSHLPDFGERILRDVYRETTLEVAALDRGLKAVAGCAVRLVVLHYAPCTDTIEGEPPGIWTMLGSDRLAAPVVEHEPDLVVHGHAHAGTFEGRLADVPVFNVSVPVMKRDFWVFELACAERRASAIH